MYAIRSYYAFTQIGTYDVTLTMRRDDGEEGISEAVIVKQGFVVVNELIVSYNFV